MDYAAIETLRDTHPAWRMLRADQPPVCAFRGTVLGSRTIRKEFVFHEVRIEPAEFLWRHVDWSAPIA